MSKNDSYPKFVIAAYAFKGKNNDELCFKKGDVITITQIDDGGWWEGTLNDKTGWFPANYVKEYKPPDSGSTSAKVSPEKSSPDSPLHLKMNRDIVLRDIVESERANVNEMQGLVNSYLLPLELAKFLKKEEYKQLIGNILEALDIHQHLLAKLDSALTQGAESRVGNVFLTIASKIKSVLTNYCTGHPQAVCILDRYRDELNEFMEQNGAMSPGILVLTTGLSKPFRRLDRYTAMLHELERHTEKSHPDRGDTQRSASVYRDISDHCAAIRKERELALQILTAGIKGWEGEELSTLGDIIHIGPVTLMVGSEKKDRYFVLFPSTLLVLSTSIRMSSFVYEGKLPLTGINAVPTEPTEEIKSAFEISGPMIESITVVCQSKDERRHWIDLLNKEQNHTRSPTTLSHSSSQSFKLLAAGMEKNKSPEIKAPWSLASLRPAPPIYCSKRNGKAISIESSSISVKKGTERQFEDDAIILKVIEGYCLTANARFTIHSAMLDFYTPHKVCDNKSFLNNKVGIWDEYENRSLQEIVKTLKIDVLDLQTQISSLSKQLDDEKKSRLLLAATVKHSLGIADGTVP